MPITTFVLSSDVDVYFTEDDFRGSESELSILVGVSKSRRIASPLSLVLTPFEVPVIPPSFSVDAVSQATCPDSCSCECQLNAALYGKQASYDCMPYRVLHTL